MKPIRFIAFRGSAGARPSTGLGMMANFMVQSEGKRRADALDVSTLTSMDEDDVVDATLRSTWIRRRFLAPLSYYDEEYLARDQAAFRPPQMSPAGVHHR
jgi:hypothetical protein